MNTAVTCGGYSRFRGDAPKSCTESNIYFFFTMAVLIACSVGVCAFIGIRKHEFATQPVTINHRRLDWTSNCRPDLLSTLPNPTSPSTPMLKRPAYMASFPGSGDKLFSKYLVEMISGMEVSEASVSPSLFKLQELGRSGSSIGGQGGVFGVRTHFPHTSGKLASWDSEIPLAVVILRNPLHAIPSYFNEVYELRNHLPPGSSKDLQHKADTHETWITWRDNQFPSQIMLYRRFVSFWMERHIEDDNNRIFFTYEDLVEWYKGPGESKRLYQFIERAIRENVVDMVKSDSVEGVTFEDKDAIDALIKDAAKHLVKEDDTPCIWKELVAPTSQTQNRRLQSTDPPYSSSAGGDWDSLERPLTPENLAALSQMLLELMNRWSRHQRLLNIIAGYHRDVNKLYLEVSRGQQDRIALPGSSESIEKQTSTDFLSGSPDPKLSKNFHIIQASPPSPHTASTIATNWLLGLLAPFSDYAFMTGTWPDMPVQQSGKEVSIETHVVTKSHDMEILQMYKKMKNLFDEIFFVLSYDKSDTSTIMKEELCQYKNVLCISHEELMFSSQEEMKDMIERLTARLKARFAYFFGTTEWLTEKDKINCYRRLQDLARAKIDMAEQPMDMSDMKFGVHGSRQKKKCPPSLVTC